MALSGHRPTERGAENREPLTVIPNKARNLFLLDAFDIW